ncbi:jg128, partial [Pararge aegeria aegeria]
LESIIHNASHIIIPLMKQNYYQCDECLSHYYSRDQLDEHHETKHLKSAIKSQTSIRSNCKVKIENPDDEIDIEDKNVVETLVKSNLKDTTTQYKSLMENTDIKYDNGCDFYVKEECSRHNSIEMDRDDNGSENVDDELCNYKVESIKSRLRFEGDDDMFHNNILSDFITECKVKMINEPITQMPIILNNSHLQLIQNNNVVKLKNSTDACNDTETDEYEFDNFLVRNGQKADRHNETVPTINGQIIDNFAPEPIYNSVHYTDLIRPGVFLCKYCCKSFPNR